MRFFITEHCAQRYVERIESVDKTDVDNAIIDKLNKAIDITGRIRREQRNSVVKTYDLSDERVRVLRLGDEIFIARKASASKEDYRILTCYKQQQEMIYSTEISEIKKMNSKREEKTDYFDQYIAAQKYNEILKQEIVENNTKIDVLTKENLFLKSSAKNIKLERQEQNTKAHYQARIDDLNKQLKASHKENGELKKELYELKLKS